MKAGFRIAAVFALLSCGPAAASDEGAFQLFEEEAVVIASAKRAQRVTKAAANAAVITAKDIEFYGYRTVGEALQSLPGFYATTDRNYSYLWVRGFGRPGDYSSRILLLINGHRINENLYGSAYYGHEFPLDVKAIARIEVVKGPGAALYGDNAFFAVVNVVTRTADDAAGARVNAEAASYGTHKEFADIGHRFKNGASIYAAGSYRNMLGQKLRYPEFSQINGGAADSENDREKDGGFFLSLSADGWTFQGSANSRKKGIPTAAFNDRFNDPRSFTVDSRSFIELQKKARLTETLELTGRLYYDKYHYMGRYVSDNPAPPPDQFANYDCARASWYGEELRLQADLGGENVFILGQEYEKNAVGSQQNYNKDPYEQLLDLNYTPHRWAVFAQQELRLRSDLNMTLGVRYDRYKTFGHTTNPRLAVVYNPWEGNALKLMAGSAFRAPSPYELLYYYAGTNKDNPALRPERIRTYEAYWEQQLPDRRGHVAAGYFRNYIRNLISQTLDPADGLVQFVNKERILSQGLELASRLRMGGGLSAHAGYILQNTRELGGDRLSNSPEHSGTAGVSAQFRTMGASAAAEVFVIGRRKTFQGTRLPAAALLSLNLSAQPWSGGLRCYLGVYNLTNAAYKASGAAEHVQAAIPQDRRNYVFGLEQRF